MLITKEVEVVLCNRNIKWFEDKGYEIPRIKKTRYDKNGHNKGLRASVPKGTTIKVDVHDLQPTSTAKIEYECDYCHKIRSVSWGKYMVQNHDGKTYCGNCAQKVLCSGENSYRWNYNLTYEERENGRNTFENNQFVQKVLARDNYTCQCCGRTKIKLAVHHLNGWNWDLEHRYDVTNGITLCDDENGCHKKFHAIYGSGNNTKEQFEEFTNSQNIIIDDYNGEIPTSKWAYCITDNEIIKNVRKYSEEHNLDSTGVYSCCNGKQNTYKNKVYIWYDIFLKMTPMEIDEYVKIKTKKRDYSYVKDIVSEYCCKKVICLTTNKIFDSIADASRCTNSNTAGICNCCKGKASYAGSLPNGTCLQWMYYDEYLEKVNNGEEVNITNIKKYNDKIICITTMNIFEKFKDGAKYFNIKDCTGICMACKKKIKSSGKLPDGTKLQWLYLSEYLEQHKNEIENIDEFIEQHTVK